MDPRESENSIFGERGAAVLTIFTYVCVLCVWNVCIYVCMWKSELSEKYNKVGENWQNMNVKSREDLLHWARSTAGFFALKICSERIAGEYINM